ncbi:4Fe-4S dicluster domain-containing protein [Halomonas sp. HNIBRBA4712]|uniref:4Fe-4S dicluster domain-containing protein n=1 Tax=Halomonas sp. HNIBRBA4712 TaxID=3373087 RepID=UPI003746EA93
MQPIALHDITPPPTRPRPAERGGVRESPGVYRRLRRSLNAVLIGGFALLPWLTVHGRPAVWFDIPGREFHLASATFYPQEFILLALALIAAAFGLFALTALAGRAWCGYTCPQSVWTFAFRWVEHRLEGPPARRARRATSAARCRILFKHAAWALIALSTAVTLVGYFTPIRTLASELATLALQGWALFWVGFFALVTYLNAGWLRERVCLHICPYARFQSVMFERDTLAVGFDTARDDCIDCGLCVQVCPTGIDIRHGPQQYACLQCGACVDACNAVMERIQKPRGLVRHTTQRRLEGSAPARLRPRLLGYLAAFSLALAALVLTLDQRVPVSFEAERARATLYAPAAGGQTRNDYRLTVRNRDRKAQTYRLSVEGLPGARLETTALTVPAGATRSQVVSVTAPASSDAFSRPFDFVLEAEPALRVERASRFLSGERR